MNQANNANGDIYMLQLRTETFASDVRSFIGKLPYSRITANDCDQLIRSSGSVGANYIEAREAFSKNDFLYRIRICRKEAKESAYWLVLLEKNIPLANQIEHKRLVKECDELVRIFTAIAKTTQSRYAGKKS